ncbi:MAG: response regulator [Clostridium sp.]
MKILVIDDEPLIHISIEKLIQACSKEDEVLHAYNGHEMLKMLEEHEIAMAYVDIKMPGPSGLEAIKLGKEISPDTRYYIMTGFNEFEYAKQAVKLKVEDYLMKPLDKKTI